MPHPVKQPPEPQPPAPGVPPPRQGPRPLALHLATALATWTSSRGALPHLMRGSLSLRPALEPQAAALRASLDGVDPAVLDQALEREIRRRAERYLSGIERYRRHPYRRSLAEAPAVWREGAIALRDYGATAPRASGGPVVLFVPSLVNRGYILDLAEGNSFLRWLAAEGFRPLLVDWGRPGEAERGYALSDYIAGPLERCLDVAVARAGGPVGLVGYCMGGTLALGLMSRRAADVSALALLATPWDFHADRPEFARALAAGCAPLLRLADCLGELPTDLLQALFALLDPHLATRKFLRFAASEPGSAQERAFVALEDWLNDGVPLVARVARECIEGWYGENTPGRGAWRVAGRAVDPREIAQPTLVFLPAEDRIVPPPSAEAVLRLIPRAERLQPRVGHIGMMVSGIAEGTVWRPLAAWLARNTAAAA
ncbi:MAG: alpha/beta fold hydrolase [Alphaproteobacteria bacterium]